MHDKTYSVRRSDRALTDSEALTILHDGQYGILSTIGPDALPYGVPLSYVVLNNCIYFHCAHEGRKIDNLSHSPQACFTVVGAVESVYDNGFSTWYESAMVFGEVQKIDDPTEKKHCLLALATKYLPDFLEHAEHDIARSLQRTAIYGMKIEHITGKAKRKALPN